MKRYATVIPPVVPHKGRTSVLVVISVRGSQAIGQEIRGFTRKGGSVAGETSDQRLGIGTEDQA
jgi:hypothetical protein